MRELLQRHGASSVAVEERELAFTAASPTAWFAEQEARHPVWRHVRAQVADDRWAGVRDETVALLTEANEDPAAFRTTSRYLLVRAAR